MKYSAEKKGFVFKEEAKEEIVRVKKLLSDARKRESKANKHFMETVNKYFPESYMEPEYFAWQREVVASRYLYWELSALFRKHSLYICSWCDKWSSHELPIDYSNHYCKHCNTMNQFCVPEPKNSDRPLGPAP
jgi:hypothetical protein